MRYPDNKIIQFDFALYHNVRRLLKLADGEYLRYIDVKNLKELDCGGTSLWSLVDLDKCESLEKIDFRSNLISHIDSLSKLPSLRVLRLGLNKIHDISSLASLVDLIELDISLNDISDISSLSSLTKLKFLQLNNNPITDIEPLVENYNQGGLRESRIILYGCPLNERSKNDFIPFLKSNGAHVIH